MATVRPATPADFGVVLPLLETFGRTRMGHADWRRLLFDPPWPVNETTRGFVLEDGSRVCGFLGTIFSSRLVRGVERRFCNLSTWVVSPSHRTSSFQLLLPVLALKSYTLVNLSASDTAHEIFVRLGFRTLEERQVLLPPLPRLRDVLAPGIRVTGRPEEIASRLDPAGRRLFEDMRNTLAAQILITRGSRTCHAIATRSPWKKGLFLAHVQYASDWELLLDGVPQATAGWFGALGTVGLRVDGRRVPEGRALPPRSVRRGLALPTLYRPADPDLTPDDVDGLYSELVLQRW